MPDRIARLRWELHIEWLEQIPDEELVSYPAWILQKHFVDASGQPENTKMTSVLEIPLPLFGESDGWNLRDAAKEVSGLHYSSGGGLETRASYLGWDEAAVKAEAKDHMKKEIRVLDAKRAERRAQDMALHEVYLSRISQASRSTVNSPVGSYAVDSKCLCKEWPQNTQLMTLDVHQSAVPGVFEAAVDFGPFKGVMILGRRRVALQEYRNKFKDRQPRDSDRKREDYYSDEEEGASTEQVSQEHDQTRQPGSSKRKANAPKGANKKAKTSKNSKMFYHTRMRGMETGEGETGIDMDKGSLTFDNDTFASLSGTTSISWCVAESDWTAHKISDVPRQIEEPWGEFV